MRTTNTVIAFDMRDPAQVAALAKALEPTAAERASLRFRNTCARTNEFASRHLNAEQRMALMMDRRAVPAGVVGALRDELAALIASEETARRAAFGAPALALAAE